MTAESMPTALSSPVMEDNWPISRDNNNELDMKIMRALSKSICKIATFLATAAGLWAFVCCSEVELQKPSEESDKLSFDVSLSNGWNAVSTRSDDSQSVESEPINLADSDLWIFSSVADINCDGGNVPQAVTRASAVGSDDFYSSFGVYGYVFSGRGSWDDNRSSAQLYMDGEAKSGSDSNVWDTEAKHYWPGSQYSLKFFAYAPYDAGTVNVADNRPKVDYSVPQEVRKQVDLLIADEVETASATEGTEASYSGTVSGDYNKTARLHFYHALTAVKIKAVGDLTGTIRSVKLSGVIGSGVHEFGTDTWNTDGSHTTTSFSQELNVELPGGVTDDQIVTDGESTFMMIPQKLGNDAMLEVTFGDGTTLKGSLAGRDWPMGKMVTYRISKTNVEYVFEATQPEGFSFTGGSQGFTVTSYKKVVKDGVEDREPVTWQIAESAYSVDGGETWVAAKPAWLSSITESGEGDAMSCGSEVSAQTTDTLKPYDDKLSEQPMVSEYDLSTQGGKTPVNTANCYVVNAPGSYSLPLVYGNAIKDGASNPSSYTSTAEGEYILKNFVNHLDKPITSPYIYENENCEPVDAVLVWQDVQNLVTPSSIKLSADRHSLVFEVSKETIKQGNAIVAVRDADKKIMWSWHIWVTDYRLGDDIKTVTDHDGYKYKMMPRNVGWCDGGTKEYPGRSVMVKIIQAESGIARTVTINQLSFSARVSGRNTYYQFGRKDPMLPGDDKTNGVLLDRKYYSEDYTFTPNGSKGASIGTSIQNPHVLYDDDGAFTPYDWCINRYVNRWNMDGSSSSSIVKTVYDPSPVGYCLPAPNVFTGFTPTGVNTGPESVKGTLVGHDDGWDLNCVDADGRPSMVFFPFLGCRDHTNGALNVAYAGYYWTAMPYNVMQLYYGGLNPKDSNFHRSYAFSVRPVKE